MITGASELRVKESDRIAAVVANLRAIGADAEELPDGMRIRRVGAGRCAGRVVDAWRSSARDGVRRPRRAAGQRDRDRRSRLRRRVVSRVLERPRDASRDARERARFASSSRSTGRPRRASRRRRSGSRGGSAIRHVDSGALYRAATAAQLAARQRRRDVDGGRRAARGARASRFAPRTARSFR